MAENTDNGCNPQFSVAIREPLIPVGAPTPILFPQIANVLHQDIKISDHTSVANAFGAVAGDVVLQETSTIKVAENGAFLCSWRGGSDRCSDLVSALQTSEDALTTLLRKSAKENEVPFVTPDFSAKTHEAETKDGVLFLGVTLSAEMRG